MRCSRPHLCPAGGDGGRLRAGSASPGPFGASLPGARAAPTALPPAAGAGAVAGALAAAGAAAGALSAPAGAELTSPAPTSPSSSSPDSFSDGSGDGSLRGTGEGEGLLRRGLNTAGLRLRGLNSRECMKTLCCRLPERVEEGGLDVQLDLCRVPPGSSIGKQHLPMQRTTHRTGSHVVTQQMSLSEHLSNRP